MPSHPTAGFTHGWSPGLRVNALRLLPGFPQWVMTRHYPLTVAGAAVDWGPCMGHLHHIPICSPHAWTCELGKPCGGICGQTRRVVKGVIWQNWRIGKPSEFYRNSIGPCSGPAKWDCDCLPQPKSARTRTAPKALQSGIWSSLKCH